MHLYNIGHEEAMTRNNFGCEKCTKVERGNPINNNFEVKGGSARDNHLPLSEMF